MAKYVKTDYVPDGKLNYLTSGREYFISMCDGRGGWFINDMKESTYTLYNSSYYLDGKSWTVINR